MTDRVPGLKTASTDPRLLLLDFPCAIGNILPLEQYFFSYQHSRNGPIHIHLVDPHAYNMHPLVVIENAGGDGEKTMTSTHLRNNILFLEKWVKVQVFKTLLMPLTSLM